MGYRGDKQRRLSWVNLRLPIVCLSVCLGIYFLGWVLWAPQKASLTRAKEADALQQQLLQATESLDSQMLSGHLRRSSFQSSLQAIREGIVVLANLAATPVMSSASASLDATSAFRGLSLPCADWDPLPPGEPLIGRASYENISLIDVDLRVHYEPIDGHSKPPHELQAYPMSAYWFWVKRKQWELGTLFVFKNILDKQTVVIDFGSWIGPTVLYAAAFAGEVWGIEADAAAYGEMVRNTAANAGSSNAAVGDNVHLRNICIDAEPGVRAFSVLNTAGDSMSSLLWQAGTHAKGEVANDASPGYASTQWHVPCIDLPTFIAKHTGLQGLPAPPTVAAPPPPTSGGPQAQHAYERLAALQKGQLHDTCAGLRPPVSKLFVKMDTEGGELLIMPQAAEWLAKAGATVLLSVHVAHVENHKENGYPMSSRHAVAAAIRHFPLVYALEASGRGAINPKPLDITDLNGETLCHDCEYLLRTEPLPAHTLAAIDAFNAKN